MAWAACRDSAVPRLRARVHAWCRSSCNAGECAPGQHGARRCHSYQHSGTLQDSLHYSGLLAAHWLHPLTAPVTNLPCPPHRYELERGPGKVQVVATLAPNIFHAGFSPAVVMAELERARANILGPEAPEGLGLVLLNWLDYEVGA